MESQLEEFAAKLMHTFQIVGPNLIAMGTQ
jgi:hypothetical protein